MVRPRVTVFALSLALTLALLPSFAAGGRIGVGLDSSTMYQKAGILAVKVSEVFVSSRLKHIKSGDYIYAVNQKYVKSVDDLVATVNGYNPGDVVRAYYFRTSDGFREYYEDVLLVEAPPIYKSTNSYQAPPPAPPA